MDWIIDIQKCHKNKNWKRGHTIFKKIERKSIIHGLNRLIEKWIDSTKIENDKKKEWNDWKKKMNR